MRLRLALAAALVAAPAFAQSPQPQPQPEAETAARLVLICGADNATRSAFSHEYGAKPVFMTAEQARDARAAGATWSTPRCMTDREHARYQRLTQAYAAR